MTSRTVLTTLTALVLTASLCRCGDDSVCESPAMLTRSDRVCTYDATCGGTGYRLSSTWKPLNGAQSEVIYECLHGDGSTLAKATITVDENPPPFCQAAGFLEHCGFEVELPGQ